MTLSFWIIKTAATTLGETAGDTVTMTLDWGYLDGTALFFAALVALVGLQIISRKFHPLYWATPWRPCVEPSAGLGGSRDLHHRLSAHPAATGRVAPGPT